MRVIVNAPLIVDVVTLFESSVSSSVYEVIGSPPSEGALQDALNTVPDKDNVGGEGFAGLDGIVTGEKDADWLVPKAFVAVIVYVKVLPADKPGTV